jgi:hypothetical protein
VLHAMEQHAYGGSGMYLIGVERPDVVRRDFRYGSKADVANFAKMFAQLSIPEL